MERIPKTVGVRGEGKEEKNLELRKEPVFLL